jgi:hypothetical protein
MTIALNESNRLESKSDDLTVGAVYTVGFGCFNEQEQTRGGMENYHDRVVNIKKIEALYVIFRDRVDNFFGVESGVELYSDYILGNPFDSKEHYVNFKLEIRQSMRSMWDINMLPIIEEFIEQVTNEQEFVHLKTDALDRTEIIMKALGLD